MTHHDAFPNEEKAIAKLRQKINSTDIEARAVEFERQADRRLMLALFGVEVLHGAEVTESAIVAIEEGDEA